MAYRPSAASSRIKGFGLNMFSEDELYDLHMATLEVLEKTGIKVYDAEARKYFFRCRMQSRRIEHDRKVPQLAR